MKLFSICTAPAAVLKDEWFLKTLRDDWELHIVDLDDVPQGNGDYLSREWYYCIRKKFDILLDAIAANPDGIIIWADIDIQFFRPCAGIIRRCLQDRDIVFQRWNRSGSEINSGFMAIRCNDRSRAFFKAVSATDFSRRAFADQDAINDLLKAGSPPIRWGVFPRTFYHVYLGPAPGRIALHHGCGAPPPGIRDGRFISSIEHKIDQMIMIRHQAQTPWWRHLLRRLRRTLLCP
ncbi:MAG: glycosyltransferase family 77 protein [Deltaproteobacteria bacterium]|nr:glycosyltransferase family 77 protein [Deltaproteobacteria bacterium]